MKILHVIASANPAGGGPIEGIRQIGAALKAIGHEIEVVCCDDPKQPWIENPHFKIHGLGPSIGGYQYNSRLIPWLLSNAPKYDAVIANGIWQFSSFATRKAMRKLGRPYAVFTHGMMDPWFKREYPLKHIKKSLYWPWGEYLVLRDAGTVLFTCEEERILARRSFSKYRANERVVSYGTAGPVGDAPLQADLFLNQFPLLRGKRFALYLSRIHPKKGCDMLIRAFASICKEDPTLALVIAGPDQVGWQSKLIDLACSLGISDRITWTGMIQGDLKWGAYHASDAFILPSHQENFGIVVAEALACQKPVLISNRVNIWREIESDGAGLVEDDTEEGTVKLLNRWLALDKEQSAGLGQRARTCFQNRFEIQIAAQSLLDELQAMV